MSSANRNSVGAGHKPSAPPTPRRRQPPALAVAQRRQTPDERRRFDAALDVVLAEWVRQHLATAGENSDGQ